jgi:hypothetical protein
MKRMSTVVPTLLAMLGLASVPLSAQEAATERFDAQALADRVQKDVAGLRGLPFKRPVKAETQTADAFGKYLDEQMDQSVPSSVAAHYGAIVRKLGLYRGPEIQNGPALMKSIAASQAAAYYDPTRETFYVLVSNIPEMFMGTLFAHELYHGLQDQHFEIDRYLGMGALNAEAKLSMDQQLARQAVVEGEATYMMSLWMMQRMTGQAPTRELMANLVRMQSSMDMKTLAATVKQSKVAELMGPDMEDALAASKEIPPFIMEMMMGAYMKGLNFIFEVQEGGWDEVAKLYTEYPPASMEQILHPEKWFAREEPVQFTWPSFERNKVFEDWDLLEQNTLGELMWRLIFAEHGMSAGARSIASGWNGDRYAVLRNAGNGEMLLLLRTSWDTNDEARQFAESYEKLLEVKYAQEPQATRVTRKGKDVFIIEGGTASSLDAMEKFVRKANRSRS